MKDYTFKISLIGDEAVGKTSLFKRYVDGVFKANYQITIGFDFSNKFVELENGAKVTLSIYDFAGQQRFRFLNSTAFLGAAAVIYVFDLTRPSTLESVFEWAGYNKQHNKNWYECVELVVGNKLDLWQDNKVIDADTLSDFHNRISEKSRIRAENYFYSSAKNGDNVEEIFTTTAKLIHKERFC